MTKEEEEEEEEEEEGEEEEKDREDLQKLSDTSCGLIIEFVCTCMVRIQWANIKREGRKKSKKTAKMARNGQKRHGNNIVLGQNRFTLA